MLIIIDTDEDTSGFLSRRYHAIAFPFWLGFPEGQVRTCYQLGMVRQYLIEACAPENSYLHRIADDIDQKLSEDTGLLVEKLMIRYWVLSCCEYYCWYAKPSVDYSITIEQLLDPPAVCFRPERKDPFSQFHKYGLMFRCYDLIRSRAAPLPLMESSVRSSIDVVYSRLWSRAYQWLDYV